LSCAWTRTCCCQARSRCCWTTSTPIRVPRPGARPDVPGQPGGPKATPDTDAWGGGMSGQRASGPSGQDPGALVRDPDAGNGPVRMRARRVAGAEPAHAGPRRRGRVPAREIPAGRRPGDLPSRRAVAVPHVPLPGPAVPGPGAPARTARRRPSRPRGKDLRPGRKPLPPTRSSASTRTPPEPDGPVPGPASRHPASTGSSSRSSCHPQTTRPRHAPLRCVPSPSQPGGAACSGSSSWTTNRSRPRLSSSRRARTRHRPQLLRAHPQPGPGPTRPAPGNR